MISPTKEHQKHTTDTRVSHFISNPTDFLGLHNSKIVKHRQYSISQFHTTMHTKCIQHMYTIPLQGSLDAL